VRGRVFVAAVTSLALGLSGVASAPSALAQQAGEDAAPVESAVVVAPSAGSVADASLRAADGELVAMRTRASRTYVSAGGRGFATRVFAEPVNYRDAAGAWQRIDPSLRSSSGGFDNVAADFDVSLPKDATGAVAVSSGARRVAFRLQGAAPVAAEVSGAAARYRSVRAGVDVLLESTTAGLKETVVLTGPGSPASSVFSVELSTGLRLVPTPQGGLQVRDGLGQSVFEIAAPFAVDSAERPAYTDAVRLVVGGTAASPTVTLTVDQAWLTDPARVFPVLVDPTTSPFASPDGTYIDSGASTTNYHTASATTLKAGGPYRTLLHFDVAAALPRDIATLTSDVRLWVQSSTAASTALSVHPLTAPFSGSSATWVKRTASSNWTTAGGDHGPAMRTRSVDTVGQEWAWLVTDLVRGWLDAPASNHGVLLKAADTSAGVVDLRGRSSTNPPYLNVNWVPRAGLRALYTYDEQDLSDTTAIAVNVATGNLTYTAQDASLTGPQLSLNVTRHYNSLAAPPNSTGHPLPSRWGLSLGRDVSIDPYPDGVLFTGTTGDAMWFRLTGGSGTSETFASPPGANATLTRNASTFGYELQLHQPYLRYSFHFSGLLTGVTDAHGNQLTVGYHQSPPTASSRATSLTDTVGRTQALTYDTSSRLTALSDGSWAGTGATSVGYAYDTNGRLSSATDREGNLTTYGYGCTGAGGRLCSITDPRGFTTTIAYDTRGRVTSITRPLSSTQSAVTAFAYTASASGGTTVVTDANNGTTTYTWDANSQVTSVQDPLGHTRDRTYTANGDVATLTGATVTGGSRATTTYSYDTATGSGGQPATNNLLSTLSPTGAQTSNRYAQVSGAARYLPRAGTDAQDNRRAYTYSTAGNVKTVSEADSSDQPVSGGVSVTFTHQGEDGVTCAGKPGALCQAIDGRGKTTSYTYGQTINGVAHPRHELTTVTPPAPLAAQTFEYDAWSRVTAQNVVRSSGQSAERRTFTYDRLGRDKTSTYPGPSSVSYVYDGNGNITSRTDGSGTTSYTYDRANRLLTKSIPGGATITLTYDKLGNLLTHTAHGDTLTYTYDAANRLIRLVEPGGNCDAIPKPDRCTRFTYDDDDRRLQTLYPNDVVQSSAYDPSGRQTKAEATGPAGLLDSFTYGYDRTVSTGSGSGGSGTADGSLRTSMTHKTRATDSGLVTRYSYDTLDRLAAATAYQAEIGGDSPTAWWKLDETSGTTATDSAGSAAGGTGTGLYPGTYASSALTRGVGGAVLGGTIPTTGAPTDRLALRVDNPTAVGAGQVTVSDSAALRLDGAFSLSLWVKITAAPAAGTYPGMLVKGSPWQAGGGYELYYSDNNSDGAVTATFKMHGKDGLWFGADTLTVGRWHHLAVTYDGTPTLAGTVRTYLDGVQKHTEVALLGASTTTDPLLLGRNHNGGRSTVDDIALFSNALTADEVHRHHRAALADAAYTYDKAGNRTAQRDLHARTTDPSDNQLRWTLNDANQITARDSTTSGFTYDGYGNTLRTLTGAGDQSTTYTTRDQATSWTRTGGPTQQTAGYASNTHQERLTTTIGSTTTTWTNSPLGETSTSTGSGSSLVSYVRDPSGQLLGIRVGTSTNATRYYFTFDGLGSITGLTDSTGVRVNTYRYDPYGQLLSLSEGLAQPFRYTGGIHDNSTGLTKLGIRYYDPALGRFTQPDPTGQDPHYVYAGNNPASFVDPDGDAAFLAPLAAVAIRAAAPSIARFVAGRLGSQAGARNALGRAFGRGIANPRNVRYFADRVGSLNSGQIRVGLSVARNTGAARPAIRVRSGPGSNFFLD
jgi:RHS repeat-associated protein